MRLLDLAVTPVNVLSSNLTVTVKRGASAVLPGLFVTVILLYFYSQSVQVQFSLVYIAVL